MAGQSLTRDVVRVAKWVSSPRITHHLPGYCTKRRMKPVRDSQGILLDRMNERSVNSRFHYNLHPSRSKVWLHVYLSLTVDGKKELNTWKQFDVIRAIGPRNLLERLYPRLQPLSINPVSMHQWWSQFDESPLWEGAASSRSMMTYFACLPRSKYLNKRHCGMCRSSSWLALSWPTQAQGRVTWKSCLEHLEVLLSIPRNLFGRFSCGCL